MAYRLLLQTGWPSWLYAVTMGATTVWERWDSMLPDGSINPGQMTSFNHYALGAVADWLHRRVAGLAPAAPGYRELVVRPAPARASPRPRHAIARRTATRRSSWRRADGRFALGSSCRSGPSRPCTSRAAGAGAGGARQPRLAGADPAAATAAAGGRDGARRARPRADLGGRRRGGGGDRRGRDGAQAAAGSCGSWTRRRAGSADARALVPPEPRRTGRAQSLAGPAGPPPAARGDVDTAVKSR